VTPRADPVVFFETPAAFRRWLKKNHARAEELWVGFRRRATGLPSLTWPQSVDEALCFGWIDGLRKSIDAQSYKIRFTPRRPGSNWSKINIDRVAELTRLGLMQAAGLAAFGKRKEERSGVYTYEQRQTAAFPADELARLQANAKAWAHFERRPPWYRKQCTLWVMSAKRQETRARRLTALIDACAAGEAIAPMKYSKR
jgi:uncharacterized protein YdeI (YjbR/CyaY-like superfamily)